jgi:GNAT superfamily N-acetyltransferase
VSDQGQPGQGWTVVLRRRPARIVAGRPEGGYTHAYEIICCDCGDHPDLDYRQVSPALQRIRGPYPLAAGIAACEQHVRRHQSRGRGLATLLIAAAEAEAAARGCSQAVHFTCACQARAL